MRLLLELHIVRTRVCPHSGCCRDNSEWVEGIKSLPQGKAVSPRQMPREDVDVSIPRDFHMRGQKTEQPDCSEVGLSLSQWLNRILSKVPSNLVCFLTQLTKTRNLFINHQYCVNTLLQL